MPRGPVPRSRAVRSDRATSRPPRAQPVERRRHRSPASASTTSRPSFADDHADARGDPPAARPARSARPAAAYACGASTCPTAARSTTRTTSTSSTGSSALRVAVDRVARRQPRGPDRADRRLEHRAAGRGRLGHDGLRGPHPRVASPSARRSRRSSTPATPTSSARITPGRVHLLGLPAAARSPEARACASTSSSARRPSRHASIGRLRSTARSARARAPSDHAPVVIDLG